MDEQLDNVDNDYLNKIESLNKVVEDLQLKVANQTESQSKLLKELESERSRAINLERERDTANNAFLKTSKEVTEDNYLEGIR